MQHKKLIIFLIALVIGLAVVLWIVAARAITKYQPSRTVLVTMTSVSTSSSSPPPSDQESEKSKSSRQASAQFGAALERVGIKTQSAASK